MTLKIYARLLPLIPLFVFSACRKKDKDNNNPSLAQLSTTAVTAITATAATSGGTITSDGGSTITAAGVCWSRTNTMPTINDDTSTSATVSGSFTAALRNLQSDKTYYVRAYAINSAGVAYGNPVYFNTVNAGPEARDLTIFGAIWVGEAIRVRYTYFDLESNPRANPAIQWYIADDTTGSALTPIAGATDTILALQTSSLGKYLKAGVTAKALSGTQVGAEVRSAWVGPVLPQETVTFTYNGQSVTYGVISSPVTGRRWLDRNLGAPGVATAYDDWQNMGDLFQWGRPADGHQLITRRPRNQLTVGVNGVTVLQSAAHIPGHALFITPPFPSYYWSTTHNKLLWQVSTGMNNVCPTGFHVPTKDEWEAEDLGNRIEAFAQLKLTLAGTRNMSTGAVGPVTEGYYWTSTFLSTDTSMYVNTIIIPDFNDAYTYGAHLPANGSSVRCIKD